VRPLLAFLVLGLKPKALSYKLTPNEAKGLKKFEKNNTIQALAFDLAFTTFAGLLYFF